MKQQILALMVSLCWTGLLPAQTGSIVISGDIPAPLTITAQDLAALPREVAVMEEADSGKVHYEGVALIDILKKAGLPYGSNMRGKNLAGYIVAKAHDGYQVVFSLGELEPDLGAEKVLVVDKREGKPLFEYQGPLRLIIPADKKGARSVRMLEKIEIVRLQK